MRRLALAVEQGPQAPRRAALLLPIGKTGQESLKGRPCSFQGRICAELIFQALHAAPDLFGFFRNDCQCGRRSKGGCRRFVRPASAAKPVHEVGDKAAMFPVPGRGSPEAFQGRKQQLNARKRAAPPELMPYGAGRFLGFLARVGLIEAFKERIGRLEGGGRALPFSPGKRIPPPTGLGGCDGRCAWEWSASGGCCLADCRRMGGKGGVILLSLLYMGEEFSPPMRKFFACADENSSP